MKRFSASSILLGITLLLTTSFLIVLGSDQQQINTDPIVDITPPPSSSSLSEQYKTKIYSSQSLRDEVMKRFQEYLRLPTQHPKPDYIAAVDYLLKWTSSIFHVDSADPIKEVQVNSNLKTGENSIIKYYIFHCNPVKPSFIFTWKGKDQSKGSIMINSHTDVVPVDKDQWKYSPFEATMVDENTGKGRRVYSRGSQDMKNIGTSYMEAITALVESGFKPERNLQVVFIADEEIGGSDGWECLIKNEELWKELNISFGLDEGLASGLDENIVPIYYGENVAHWFEITATGNVGHGSQFIQQTATEKIYKLLNEKVFPFREQQQVQMKIQTSNPREKTQCSTVVTINLTGLRAGHTNKESGEFSSPNVIPRTATALFDMRIPPHIDLKEIEIMLRSWADFVNGTIKFIEQPKINPVADLNDETVKKFLDIVNARMNTELRIFPAATDARFPRAAGVNMIGYSFMPNTKVLLHDHNEYLDENVYLDSIVHYIAILEGLLQN